MAIVSLFYIWFACGLLFRNCCACTLGNGLVVACPDNSCGMGLSDLNPAETGRRCALFGRISCINGESDGTKGWLMVGLDLDVGSWGRAAFRRHPHSSRGLGLRRDHDCCARVAPVGASRLPQRDYALKPSLALWSRASTSTHPEAVARERLLGVTKRPSAAGYESKAPRPRRRRRAGATRPKAVSAVDYQIDTAKTQRSGP
jgi:hypothetical protein